MTTGRNGSASAQHLARLEEAERRKREMQQKRSASNISNGSTSNGAISSGRSPGPTTARQHTAGRSARPPPRQGAGGRGGQRRNGTYILMLLTTLTATVGLNLAHHVITGGSGTADVSVHAAEAFLQRHFSTVVEVLGEEVHQLQGAVGRALRRPPPAGEFSRVMADGNDDGDARPRSSKGGRFGAEGDANDHANDHDERGRAGEGGTRAEARERAAALAEPGHRERHRAGGGADPESNAIAAAGHTLGGLSCAAHGGPSDEIASEMIYWSDIPSDSDYVSPFKKKGETKYMTFEPDGGGWNNIRMAMETVVVMAHATGRTLVMPPQQRMYLLGRGTKEHKKHFGFADFYHLESLSDEHRGLEIITMEEFLKREALTGNLRNSTTGMPQFPPGNRTKWDGGNKDEITQLKEYLREVTLTPFWKPDRCMAAFPSSSGPAEIAKLHNIREDVMSNIGGNGMENKKQSPPDVLGPAVDRMRQNLLDRDLCIYDEEMQAAPVIHFMCYHKMRVRLLVHFYAFLYFANGLQDLWTKRFVRDHLRYKDELQCAAARAVHAIRERAKARNPAGNPHGFFDSFHVRRGDFQYKRTRVDADVLYKESMNELEENATIFVATDERDKSFFQPLMEHYDLVFLDDYMHLFKDMNPNNFGMLDQLIASKGRVFYGTFHSTFTGWINRMRGYYIDKHQLEGAANGTMKSYYFVPQDKKMCMTNYSHIQFPFFAREFPVAWRDLDRGIEPLASASATTATER